MNISNSPDTLAEVFSILGQPARLLIVLILAQDRACVCHIEAVTGIRQAAISQHLIVLRKTGLVGTQREGRHIYYHLVQPGWYDVICQAAEVGGFDHEKIKSLSTRPAAGCSCPLCHPEWDGKLACKK
ncbi:MAG TPA: metalloregulator ArsR/SmtB family transcription factor [Anaerolineaceae bacterium]|nr:metalloregulator ArsR/SmtB family transcription factor [Anaerolineaceae bacterium]HQP08446.1 metalloregulator ArsR/SmtB family transcription factor [Anaerolineaceae bacterium]